MRPLERACIALLAMALFGPMVHADEPTPPMLLISGFGTLGVVHSSERRADFVTSVFSPNGAGYSRAWSADVDSIIGGQIVVNVTPQLSAVLQVVSEQNADSTYRPHVEWANIKYQFTPDLSVRAGRVVMPSFLASEYRKVGYANPWVRPPPDVYSLVPITNNDGVEASYRMHLNDITHTLRFIYGGLDSKVPGGSSTKARNQWGIFDTSEIGALTARIAYHQTHLSATGPGGVAISAPCSDDLVRFGTIGASYDPGSWFLIGEWARSVSHCFVGVQNAWYVGAGRRLGKWNPYLSYARSTAKPLAPEPGFDPSAPPSSQPGPAGLDVGSSNAGPEQRTMTVGARWDITKNAAVKLQFDHIRLGRGSAGMLVNVQSDFRPGGTLKLFSATLDFVF